MTLLESVIGNLIAPGPSFHMNLDGTMSGWSRGGAWFGEVAGLSRCSQTSWCSIRVPSVWQRGGVSWLTRMAKRSWVWAIGLAPESDESDCAGEEGGLWWCRYQEPSPGLIQRACLRRHRWGSSSRSYHINGHHGTPSWGIIFGGYEERLYHISSSCGARGMIDSSVCI